MTTGNISSNKVSLSENLGRTMRYKLSDEGLREYRTTVDEFDDKLLNKADQIRRTREGSVLEPGDLKKARRELLRSNSLKAKIMKLVAAVLPGIGALLIEYSFTIEGSPIYNIVFAGGLLVFFFGLIGLAVSVFR